MLKDQYRKMGISGDVYDYCIRAEEALKDKETPILKRRLILSLGFLAVYFFATSRMNQMLTSLTQNIDKLGDAVRGRLWPLYQLGLAATGKVLPMLCWCCLVIALSLLTYALLSRSFIRIATANRGTKKAVYHAGRSKASTMDAALLRKELRRFLGSPVYLLNCGLGILFILAAGVFLLVKADTVRETLGMLLTTSNRCYSGIELYNTPSGEGGIIAEMPIQEYIAKYSWEHEDENDCFLVEYRGIVGYVKKVDALGMCY